MLLEKGADINAQGGEHDGNALQLASAGGDEKVVQMLFDTGAEASVTQEQVPEWVRGLHRSDGLAALPSDA